LEHLEKADLVIFFTRLLTLSSEQQEQIVSYIDSGKPIMGLRTANHGFRTPLPYKIAGRQVRFGEDVLGGTFRGHHGNWHQDSTRGDPLESMQGHPVLIGVQDIWGPSDVYRTFEEGGQLPAGCTALVYGQPLIGREQGGNSNPDKEPLPIVWIKDWKTTGGKTARVFHSTMASGKDFESPGLRRLVVNAAYWCLQLEDKISADSSVEYIGDYQPLASGFDYEKLGVIPQQPQQYK
jgi:type 1 glutamine amidotransferase